MLHEPIGSWRAAFHPALLARYTRLWLHYGAIGFVVACALIGAVRGLAGQ